MKRQAEQPIDFDSLLKEEIEQTKICTFLITGKEPGLMQHNPASMDIGNGNELNRKQIPTTDEEAAAGRYLTKDGHFYFPAQAFKTSFVAGGKGRRIGKSAATSVLKGTIFTLEERCLLIDPKTGKQLDENQYEVDARRVQLPGSMGKRVSIIRGRPVIPNWACKLALELDPEISPEIVLSIANRAGRNIGVGDYRPEHGGSFGRYTVRLLNGASK